jgi:hypothetical protein
MNDEPEGSSAFFQFSVHRSAFIVSSGVRFALGQPQLVGAVAAEPDVDVLGVGPEEGRDARGGADGRVGREALEVFDVDAASVETARRTFGAVEALTHAIILLAFQVGLTSIITL